MNVNHTRLFEVLDAAGLLYDVRHSTAGTPYPGFRWQCPATQRLSSFTALLESDALRLTLHEPLGPGLTLDTDACFAWQRDFPVARLYRNPEDKGKLELTAAIPVKNAMFDFFVVQSLMTHLSQNAEELSGNATGPSRQAPPLTPLGADVSLIETLREFGIHPILEGGAVSVRMQLTGLPVAGRFLTYHLGVGWIRIAAYLEKDDSLALSRVASDLVNRLQLWAPVGRFVSEVTHGKQHMGCEIATPSLGRSASEVVSLSMRLATLMLGTAYLHVTKNDV